MVECSRPTGNPGLNVDYSKGCEYKIAKNIKVEQEVQFLGTQESLFKEFE